MKVLVFSVEAEDGNVHTGRVKPSENGKQIPPEELVDLREGLETDGFKILEWELVEVQ